MSHLTLAEFQRLTHVSDAAMMWLLRHEAIPCSTDERGRVIINTTEVDIEALLQPYRERKKEYFQTRRAVLERRFARIVGVHLQEIILEAKRRTCMEAGNGTNQ